MFMTDKNYQIRQPTSQFFAAQLITQEWVEPKDLEHKLFAASSNIRDSEGHVLVTSYAVLRPDGQWSLMLINKDYDHPHAVRIMFQDDKGTRGAFAGAVTMLTFGKAQYLWHSARRDGYADPDGPSVTSIITGSADTRYTLPPASLSIVRGQVKY